MAASTSRLLLLALIACHDKPKAVAIDVVPINALVPPPLGDKLVFEQRSIAIDRVTYTVAAPKAWTQDGKLFAHLKGDHSRLEIGSNCDGECKPKDWAAIADKVNFAPRSKGKVLKDDRTANRRTMIAEVSLGGQETTDVVVAWWTDGAKQYHQCTASLDESIKGAAAAFEKACQAVAIAGEDMSR